MVRDIGPPVGCRGQDRRAPAKAAESQPSWLLSPLPYLLSQFCQRRDEVHPLHLQSCCFPSKPPGLSQASIVPRGHTDRSWVRLNTGDPLGNYSCSPRASCLKGAVVRHAAWTPSTSMPRKGKEDCWGTLEKLLDLHELHFLLSAKQE